MVRGVGEAITSVILASVIIVIASITLYYSLVTIDNGLATTEYGYIKSTFVNIANNYHYIVQGSSYVATLPHQLVGVGYRNYSDLVLSIIVDDVYVYNDTPASVCAEVYRPIATVKTIVYGSSGDYYLGCRFTVDHLRLVPCIQEYFSQGRTVLEFNTARFYITVYITNETGVERYLVRILYIRTVPRIEQQFTGNLIVNPYKDVFKYSKDGINSLRIMLVNKTSGSIIVEKDLDDIIANRNPILDVDLVIVVKQVYTVIS